MQFDLYSNQVQVRPSPHPRECQMLRTSFATEPSDVTNPPTPVGEEDESTTKTPSAVLLVARDLSLDETCRRSLSDAGVDVVVSVSNSTRAMELLSANQLFDAVVIGVGPGDVEAVMLAQHLRRHRSGTPTVVMTHMANLDIPGATTQCGVVRNVTPTQQSNFFRKTLRAAVSIRRSTRLRQPSWQWEKLR